MSTLTARETVTRLATLPRVNLLPPEIEQQRQFKKVQARPRRRRRRRARRRRGHSSSRPARRCSDAQNELDAQTARRQRPCRRTRPSTPTCPEVYAQVDAAKAQLTQAMGKEIRWSRFLNDLSLVTPGQGLADHRHGRRDRRRRARSRWLRPPGRPAGRANIGTVTFEGKGYTHNDVAVLAQGAGQREGRRRRLLHQVDPGADRDRGLGDLQQPGRHHRGPPLRPVHRQGGQLT